MLPSLHGDLHCALRQLRRAPGFAITAIFTLALGIGAATAVYSLVDGVLLRPFPLPHPEQLVAVHTAVREPGAQLNRDQTSWPNLFDWQAHNHTFRGLAGLFADDRLVTTANGTSGAVIPVNRVSTNYFDVLGVQPILGRNFVATDQQAGHHTAILGSGFWQRVLGGDPHVVGQTILISDEPYIVIGVMPRGFTEPRDETAQVWTTIAYLMEGSAPRARVRNLPMAEIVGRLKPDVTQAQAQADLSAIQAGLAASFPEIRWQNAVAVQSELDDVAGDMRAPLFLLMAAVLAVLLIVCTNVAGLILTRAMNRSGEMALRTALGASYWRIWRQLLIEGLLLGVCAGLLGATLAWLLLQIALPAIPQDIPRIADVSLSWRVLLFAAAVSLLCALVCSLTPAWRLARVAPLHALREQGQRATAGRRTRWLQNTLVIVQTTLGVTLLVASGFLMRGFVSLRNVKTGFQSDHLFAFTLPLTEAHYPHGTRALFYHQLIRKLAALPGIRSASGGYPLPARGWGTSAAVEIDGRPNPPGHDLTTLVGVAEPGFFETLKVPLLRGRLFTPADDDPRSPPVALVNQAFVKRYFPHEDPLGRSIRPDLRQLRNQAIEIDPLADAQRDIVGVIADTQQGFPLDPPQPFAVFPFAQASELMRPRLIMRVSGDPMQYQKSAAAVVQQIDPDLFLMDPRSMQMQLESITGTQHFETTLIAGFSAIALFLTSLGFYSMLAAMVTARTREIGVRMAIGATRADVARIILARAAMLLLAGATTGGIIAAGLLRAFNSSDWAHPLLFGVSWGDPRILASFVGVLAIVALSGCLLPAMRATRIDPIRVLRDE